MIIRATSSGRPARPSNVWFIRVADVEPGRLERGELLLHAGRVDHARRDADDADAAAAELEGEVLGQPDDGVLGGDVGADAPAAPEARPSRRR